MCASASCLGKMLAGSVNEEKYAGRGEAYGKKCWDLAAQGNSIFNSSALFKLAHMRYDDSLDGNQKQVALGVIME